MCEGMQGLHHSKSRKGQLQNWHLAGSVQSAQHSRPSRTCLRGIAACNSMSLLTPEQHYSCCIRCLTTLMHNLPYKRPAAHASIGLISFANYSCICITSLQQVHGSYYSFKFQNHFLACFTALRHLATSIPVNAECISMC